MRVKRLRRRYVTSPPMLRARNSEPQNRRKLRRTGAVPRSTTTLLLGLSPRYESESAMSFRAAPALELSMFKTDNLRGNLGEHKMLAPLQRIFVQHRLSGERLVRFLDLVSVRRTTSATPEGLALVGFASIFFASAYSFWGFGMERGNPKLLSVASSLTPALSSVHLSVLGQI